MPGKIIKKILFKGVNTATFQWKKFDQKAQINENEKKRVTPLIYGFLLKDGRPIIKRGIGLSLCITVATVFLEIFFNFSQKQLFV